MTERFKNNNNWQTLINQKNAYNKGIFASKKYASGDRELPSAPITTNQQEKMFWFMGVHDGLRKT